MKAPVTTTAHPGLEFLRVYVEKAGSRARLEAIEALEHELAMLKQGSTVTIIPDRPSGAGGAPTYQGMAVPFVAEVNTAKMYGRKPSGEPKKGQSSPKLGLEDAVWHFLYKHGAVSVGAVAAYFRLKSKGARGVLAKLCSENLVRMEGSRRTAKYVAVERKD